MGLVAVGKRLVRRRVLDGIVRHLLLHFGGGGRLLSPDARYDTYYQHDYDCDSRDNNFPRVRFQTPPPGTSNYIEDCVPNSDAVND